MPLEHSTVLKWPQPSPGPPGDPGTLWTADGLGSTLQTRTGSKAGLLCPLRPPVAVTATHSSLLAKKMAAYWLLPSTPRKAWEGRQCEDPEASQQGQLPPCSRAGLTPSPKAALAPGGRVATWPLWGQSVWLSAHASPGGYTDPGEDFTSLTRSSFTCEPGISVPTSSTHGSFDVTRPV